MLLIIYMGLVAAIAIWGTKKEALVLALIWFVGLFVVASLGKVGREAGAIFQVFQAIVGVYMALRLHLIVNKGRSNMSSMHTDQPFTFTPLDHEANDPRINSKHPIDGPDPRQPE
jgi:hypothetical protein